MRFLFLLPVFAPLLPLQWQPLWLIFSVSAPAIGQGVASVSFFAIMRTAIEPSHMTRLLSHRQLAVNVSVAVAALAFGLWLEGAPFPLNYQVMFLAAFAFSLISLYHCIRIRVADQKRTASEAPVVAPAPKPGLRKELSRSIGDSLRVPWRSHGFRRVALVTAVVHLVFFILVPVTPLFLVRHFGADEGYMALFGLLELAGGATASVLAPRVQRRIGTRPMIALAMIGTALAASIIAFSPNLWVALISAVISGGCWTAAAGVGLLTFFLDNTPAEESTTYSTAYHQVIGLVVFIGPMIGSLLANGGINLIVVMMFGAAVRFLAAPLIESSLFSRWRPHREPMPNAV
jgi:Na+/melibiose symporter-like transporter